RSVFATDQVLRACHKIIEYVLFVGQTAGAMPLIAVFAPTPEVRLHKNPSLIQPYACEGSGKVRLTANSVTAIPGKESRIRPIELGPFQGDEVPRASRPVLRDRIFAVPFRVVDLGGGGLEQRRAQ